MAARPFSSGGPIRMAKSAYGRVELEIVNGKISEIGVFKKSRLDWQPSGDKKKDLPSCNLYDRK